MNRNFMNINATLAAEAAKKVVGTLEDRVKEAMREAIRENWLETQQMPLFLAALGGVLTTCEEGDEDYQQLVDSLDALRKVGALLELAKLGFQADTPKLGMNVTLPLYEWWHEVFRSTPSKIKLEGQQ